MITAPVYAILTGMLAGLLSAVGFLKIGPYLKERINLSDTCGVHNLHGMPAILGCIISAISADVMNAKVTKHKFKFYYFKKIFIHKFRDIFGINIEL